MVVVSAHCCESHVAGVRVGTCRGWGAAVEHVLSALPGDQRVERAEGASFAGQDRDVGRGVFTAPKPAWQAHALAEVCGACGSAPDSQSSRRPRETQM